MEHIELVVLFLLVAVAVLTALARVLGVPYPILLVVGGSLVGFAPGVPDVQLDPDLVLLIFLPPLLFNAAYFASVRDLRASARGITLMAVGLVLATMCAVAVVIHAVVPELPWAAAFAFGAKGGFLLEIGIATITEQDQRDVQHQGSGSDLDTRVQSARLFAGYELQKTAAVPDERGHRAQQQQDDRPLSPGRPATTLIVGRHRHRSKH